jgi:uncharacterized protein with PQ loop repeat
MNYILNLLYKHKTYVGVIATLIGLASFRTVLITVWETKKTFNFPYEALILTLIGWFLTAIYGILKKAYATVFLGIIYFLIFAFILYVKITN